MPSNPKSVYWDSNVFLTYIEGAPTERLPVLDALLYEAGIQGQIVIYTSTISIVEVAFAHYEQTRRQLDQATLDAIDQMWADRSAVTLVDFHEVIGRDARELMRAAVTRGWSLKPADAIHLATARQMNVVEFHTYDNGLFKYTDIVGFPVIEPHTPQIRLLP